MTRRDRRDARGHPALSRGAGLLSSPGQDTDSVSTTSLALGEELLSAGFDAAQACLAEETVAWLGAAAWALCTSRDGGRRYIAAWGETGRPGRRSTTLPRPTRCCSVPT